MGWVGVGQLAAGWGRVEMGGGGGGWPLDVGQLESYWGRVKWGQAENVIGARLTKR